MKTYTDYPITELGDTPYQEAPVRECIVRGWDEDKYLSITVENCEDIIEVKKCYVYKEKGRIGEVDSLDNNDIIEILDYYGESE